MPEERQQRMLVVSAHVGDFIWRSAGTIAKYVQAGTAVDVLVLTYGARGESGAYWKREGATLEGCAALRRAEAEAAAEILGVADLTFCGYDDFPLLMTPERMEDLAQRIARAQPDLVLTHDLGQDPGNMDHTRTGEAVVKAIAIARARYGLPHTPVFGFEPMSPEVCAFQPDLYIDITDRYEQKYAAMECLATQRGSMPSYVERAKLRGSHCSTRGGRSDCRYAEAFTMLAPAYAHDGFVW